MTAPKREIPRRSTTFIIRIIGTENATWQGQLAHAKSGHTYTFRSCMELIQLMNEYLQRGEESMSARSGGK